MRRGKRFLENDNMFIYVGTAIFILLAIVLGIIMYMTTRTGVRIENADILNKEQQVEENTETVTSEIGKTVEEQENIIQVEEISQETINKANTAAINQEEQANIEKKQENSKGEMSVNVDEFDTSDSTNVQTKEESIEIKKEIKFVMPTEGEIICEFAKDNLIYSETLKEWITHTAIDIKADKTSVIKSSAEGVIKSIVNDPRYGLTVVIEHDDGYETVYSNLLTAEFVVEGEEVKQGQTIGTVGNTAAFESSMECHLHFELLKDGEFLDPNIYIK